MTVGIAATACERRAIVLMADKMLTGHDLLQSESAVKMVPLTHRYYALLSGDFSRARQAAYRIQDDLEKIAAEWLPIRQVITIAQQRSAEVTAEALQEEVYGPLGVSRELVFERSVAVHALPAVMIGEVREAIRRWHDESGFELLVVGFTQEVGLADMFTVKDEVIEYSGARHAAIGSGANAASAYLVQAEENLSEALDEWLYWVFEAKVAAEYYDGVGYEINGWIMTAHAGAKEIPGKKAGDPLDVLNEAYRWYHRGPFDPSKALRESPGWEGPTEPEGWRAKIRALTQPIEFQIERMPARVTEAASPTGRGRPSSRSRSGGRR